MTSLSPSATRASASLSPTSNASSSDFTASTPHDHAKRGAPAWVSQSRAISWTLTAAASGWKAPSARAPGSISACPPLPSVASRFWSFHLSNSAFPSRLGGRSLAEPSEFRAVSILQGVALSHKCARLNCFEERAVSTVEITAALGGPYLHIPTHALSFGFGPEFVPEYDLLKICQQGGRRPNRLRLNSRGRWRRRLAQVILKGTRADIRASRRRCGLLKRFASSTPGKGFPKVSYRQTQS